MEYRSIAKIKSFVLTSKHKSNVLKPVVEFHYQVFIIFVNTVKVLNLAVICIYALESL